MISRCAASLALAAAVLSGCDEFESLLAPQEVTNAPPPAPAPVPTVQLVVAPRVITAGQTASLLWVATDAQSCSAQWTTNRSSSGTQDVSPTTSTAYSLTCQGAGGAATALATLEVLAARQPAIAFVAAPGSITRGDSSTLNWSATDASSCSAPWTSLRTTSGSQRVGPSQTTTFAISCTGPGGTTSSNVVVNVQVPATPAPVVSLTASPSSVVAGQSATLTWSSANATSCSSSWSPNVAVAGSAVVVPTATTSYQVQCTGSGGTSTASATVTVQPPPSTLVVSASSLAFSSGSTGNTSGLPGAAPTQPSQPPEQQVSISHSGSASLAGLSASVMYLSGSGWLQVSLSSNATPAGLTVRPISTRPPAGTYSADVIVAAPGASNSPVKVRVTYTVAP